MVVQSPALAMPTGRARVWVSPARRRIAGNWWSGAAGSLPMCTATTTPARHRDCPHTIRSAPSRTPALDPQAAITATCHYQHEIIPTVLTKDKTRAVRKTHRQRQSSNHTNILMTPHAASIIHQESSTNHPACRRGANDRQPTTGDGHDHAGTRRPTHTPGPASHPGAALTRHARTHTETRRRTRALTLAAGHPRVTPGRRPRAKNMPGAGRLTPQPPAALPESPRGPELCDASGSPSRVRTSATHAPASR
jgi:hypothetical protein